MKLTTYLMTAFSIFCLLSVQAQDDPAVRQVDEVALTKLQRGLKNVQIHHETYQQELHTQFEKLLSDALKGELEADKVYLEPVQQAAEPLLNMFQLELSDNQIKIVQASFGRNDEAFVEKATKLIEQRQQIYNEVIAPLQASFVAAEDGEKQMTLAVFQPAADAVVNELREGGSLMKQVKIDKDKLEYFLTAESRKIWEAVQEGDDGYWLFSANYKKRMSNIMQDYLVNQKYFNAERPLKEALAKYAEDDKYYSLHLLYAFVKLINESNPDAVEEGYTILKEAFEADTKEMDRERERIAFNYLRVGTRLGKVDEATFLKLLDYVRFVEDEEGLIDLYNLAMARYIKQDMWQEASDLYDKAQEKGLAEQLPPAFVAMVLLKEGNYRSVSEEVQADSLAELMPEAK